MKIFPVADIHLGRRRLGGKLPESDFAAALQDIAENICLHISRKAQTLFNRRNHEKAELRWNSANYLGKKALTGTKPGGIIANNI